jgi:putative glycosyltransferase (TIGR04348 family)
VKILIVTPESTALPLGNSVTAERWAGILRTLHHDVDIRNSWSREECDLLIALHAHRSANSIEKFRSVYRNRPLIVALTGTDVYRDLPSSRAAKRSLDLATRIVALQECAVQELDESARAKTSIIYQSAVPPEECEPRSGEFFDVCVLSHLRTLKDPLRAAYAARLMPPSSRLRIKHAGRALELQLEMEAREEERTNSRYHWLGERSHEAAMRLLASSRLLVVSSTMEGGANVIAEAVVCGTPVLCSNIPGNIGMLGTAYPGYFALGDTQHLAELLQRVECDRSFMATLQELITNLQHRFSPEYEIACWEQLLGTLGFCL